MAFSVRATTLVGACRAGPRADSLSRTRPTARVSTSSCERAVPPARAVAAAATMMSVDRAQAHYEPIGRLAPSPTGWLHLGHARTFLLAWAHVRSRGGRLLLRLEDLDAGRCRPEYVAGIPRDLEWLGIDWDGPI